MNRTDDQFWEDTLARHDLDDTELRHAEAMLASVPAAQVDPKWVEAQVAKVAIVPMRRPRLLQRVIKVVAAAAALVVLSVYVSKFALLYRDDPYPGNTMTVRVAVEILGSPNQAANRETAIANLAGTIGGLVDELRQIRIGEDRQAQEAASDCLRRLESTLAVSSTNGNGVVDEAMVDYLRALRSNRAAAQRDTLSMTRATDIAVLCVGRLGAMASPTESEQTLWNGMREKLIRIVRAALGA